MSRVTELAEAEAAAIEAEEAAEDEAETEPEPEPEPQPEPEPEPEPQAVSERQIKALGRVVDTYFSGLQRVIGQDFAVYNQCPTCAEHVPGFVPPGVAPDPLAEYEPDPLNMQCPDCKGHGMRRSGAVNANALIMCTGCSGAGYIQRPVQAPGAQWSQVPPNGAPTVPPGYLPPSSEAMPPRDGWGRPLGHPHFGMDPSSIGV